MSSDFLTFYIISNQKAVHHVNQRFLEYLLNILCIENCGIFLKEVCDFLNLNFSYFKLFLKNLIQWNQSFIPLQLTPYLSFNNCDLVLKIFENIFCGKKWEVAKIVDSSELILQHGAVMATTLGRIKIGTLGFSIFGLST